MKTDMPHISPRWLARSAKNICNLFLSARSIYLNPSPKINGVTMNAVNSVIGIKTNILDLCFSNLDDVMYPAEKTRIQFATSSIKRMFFEFARRLIAAIRKNSKRSFK
jgi:hypothetical protein